MIGDGAFFSQLMQMSEGYTDGHTGEWFTSPGEIEETMRAYWAAAFQIHVHTNGDLAMQVVAGGRGSGGAGHCGQASDRDSQPEAQDDHRARRVLH